MSRERSFGVERRGWVGKAEVHELPHQCMRSWRNLWPASNTAMEFGVAVRWIHSFSAIQAET